MHETALDCSFIGHGLYHSHVGDSYNDISEVYQEQGKYEETLEYYHKSLNITIKVVGHPNLTVAVAYNNIGVVY